ncbi:hypothetical protein [Amnibacterium sp.]|uniref:hypothetical protein n=1 Tax=Amnibacterium sp. TaxID=1872496 RepID=UPI00263617D6|nr:hypothetical protein [Amnibacterium sp.]MCU1474486.1 hypothetical protein [Amnibacterium sp.]
MPDDALCAVEGCGHPGEAEFTTADGGAPRAWIVCGAHKRALDEGASYRIEERPGQRDALALQEG